MSGKKLLERIYLRLLFMRDDTWEARETIVRLLRRA